MTDPKIAATITENSPDSIRRMEALVDFWEVRQDLIGTGWPEVVNILKKPWIACNRGQAEGGRGQIIESVRIDVLLKGLAAGAAIVDIELSSPLLAETVSRIKKCARCLISYHNFQETPELELLSEILEKQRQAGADICKVVTTARNPDDNLVLLKLIKNFPQIPVVAFAMGPSGRLSRVLSPLAGAYFTFASLESGRESAPGQINVEAMREIYSCISTLGTPLII
jgi:3-dehydroquinate dehydratase-1